MTAVSTITESSHPQDDAVRDLIERLATCEDPSEDLRIRHELVLRSMRLADAVAHRYRDRGVDIEDLEQVARAALVSASLRYDPMVGRGFLAYAVPSISGEVKRYFRDHTWAVRPPRRLQELRLEMTSTEERLRHDLARQPTEGELAEALGVSVASVREVRQSSSGYRASSLDFPSVLGGTLGDHVAADGDDTDRIDVHWALREAMDELTERERLILHLRFDEELTQREIGEVIGVSQMQVSRLLGGVLVRLRSRVLAEAC